VTVNGKPFRSIELSHGDMIATAGWLLLYNEDSAPAVSADPLDLDPLSSSQILVRQSPYTDAEAIVAKLSVGVAAQANERLITLYRVAALLASSDELEPILERLLERIATAMHADRAFILLCDDGSPTFSRRFWWQRGQGRLAKAPRISATLLASALEERQGIVATTSTAPTDLRHGHSMQELGITSSMLIPLIHRERIHGILGVDSLTVRRTFDDDDLSYLTQIAIQAAMGIATLQTLQEPAQFSQNLRSLGRATQWLSSYLERDGIIKETVSLACTIFKCRRASIMLVDENGRLGLAYALGMGVDRTRWEQYKLDPGESIAGSVLESGKPLLVNDKPPDTAHERRYTTGSYICVPIRASEREGEHAEIQGVLNVTDRLEGRGFTPNDLELLCILANQAGIALTNAVLYEKATIDNLTRLYVRRFFFQRLNELIRKAQQRAKPLALLICDLDHFKSLNDQHGHRAGDAILRTAGKLLKSQVRQGDVPARYGGEEFIAILPDAEALVATTIGERIRSVIAIHPFEHDGKQHHVTVSVGVASLEPGDTSESLIERADQALYRAKADGRDRVVTAWPASSKPQSNTRT
jgi:diguanylate cyclase (GGDEF)-like protein